MEDVMRVWHGEYVFSLKEAALLQEFLKFYGMLDECRSSDLRMYLATPAPQAQGILLEDYSGCQEFDLSPLRVDLPSRLDVRCLIATLQAQHPESSCQFELVMQLLLGLDEPLGVRMLSNGTKEVAISRTILVNITQAPISLLVEHKFNMARYQAIRLSQEKAHPALDHKPVHLALLMNHRLARSGGNLIDKIKMLFTYEVPNERVKLSGSQ